MLLNSENQFRDLSDDALYELAYDEETGCETTAETQDDLPVTRQVRARRKRFNKARRQATSSRIRQRRNNREKEQLGSGADTEIHHWELLEDRDDE